ncbi:MAG: prepilin peptidase [Nanoarchaeota archaeon]|nr:prepilin peptidase [Nanoarchaeota archaeon]
MASVEDNILKLEILNVNLTNSKSNEATARQKLNSDPENQDYQTELAAAKRDTAALENQINNLNTEISRGNPSPSAPPTNPGDENPEPSTPSTTSGGSSSTPTTTPTNSDPNKPRWYQVKWTGKGDWSAGSSKLMFFFYVLVLLAHVIDSFVFEYRNNWMRAILYLVVFLISWFLIFGRNVKPLTQAGGQRLLMAFILALVAFLLPVIEWVLLKNIMDAKLIHILQLWIGFYPSYLIVTAQENSALEKLQKAWIGLWILLGVLFLIVGVINGGLKSLPIPESEEDFDPWESLMSVLNFIWETFWNGITSMWDFARGKINQTQAAGVGQFDYATGGYYSGNEESVEEQGVFIKNVEFSKPEFDENTPIELFYNLEMKTPTNKPVPVTITCLIESTNETNNDLFGNVDESTLDLYNNEIVPLSCVFENGVEKGNHKIKLTSSYEYETLSRIETHFIDVERKNAYRAEGIDILSDYGKDSSPVSVFTAGPMDLGIEIGTQPIGIESGSKGPRIGFTLEGDWNGIIKSVKELYIKLPKGLILGSQSGDCSKFMPFTTPEDNQNIYKYEGTINEIEEYRSFNCKTQVSNFDDLMGNNEISTKYIKVEAKYIYEDEKIETVNVVGVAE